jgi:hypothetical protein
MTGDAGYSKELGTDWKFVWGGRARAELNLIGHERLSLYGEAVYFEGAVYRRTTWTAGLTGKF